MKTIYDLKPQFQNLLRRAVDYLYTKKITANQITLSAIVLSFMMGMLLVLFSHYRWVYALVPLTLFIRMALNAMDGMLAREHNMQSSLGLFLNELGDVFSDAFIYLPFCLYKNMSATLIIAIVILAIISEMAGLLATQLGQTRRYDGPMGKSDRAFAFSIISILIFFGMQSRLIFNSLLTIILLMLFITIYNRCHKALQGTPQNV